MNQLKRRMVPSAVQLDFICLDPLDAKAGYLPNVTFDASPRSNDAQRDATKGETGTAGFRPQTDLPNPDLCQSV
jgi:hypothetical protein